MYLKAQRHSEVQNEVDRAGRPNIPYVGLALSESITGVPGEVLCELVPYLDLRVSRGDYVVESAKSPLQKGYCKSH